MSLVLRPGAISAIAGLRQIVPQLFWAKSITQSSDARSRISRHHGGLEQGFRGADLHGIFIRRDVDRGELQPGVEVVQTPAVFAPHRLGFSGNLILDRKSTRL